MDYLTEADQLFQNGELAEAYRLAVKAIELEPADVNAYAFCGKVAQAQANYEEASKYYQRASELEPENLSHCCHIADNYLLQDKYEQAELLYRQMLGDKHNNPWLLCNLGKALLYQERLEEAVCFLRQAINADLQLAEAHSTLGSALAQQGYLSEAIDCYRRAIEIDPNNSVYHHNLGDSFLLEKNYELAVDEYHIAIELNPSYFWSQYNLGRALSELGRLDELSFNFSYFANLLDRCPSDSEIELFMENLRQGNFAKTSLAEVLLESEDADNVQNIGKNNLLSNLTDREFIEYLYDTFLQRSPDQMGLENSLKALQNNNASRMTVLQGFLDSEEFRSKIRASSSAHVNLEAQLFPNLSDEDFINYIYTTFLKRPADKNGLEANLDALKADCPRSVVLEGVLRSEEFFSLANPVLLPELSNYEFLHSMWQLILRRSCDSNGEKQWLPQFDRGISRVDFLLALLNSEEFKVRVQRFLFPGAASNKPDLAKNTAWIMGTDKFIDQEQWNDILLKVLLKRSQTQSYFEIPEMSNDVKSSHQIRLTDLFSLNVKPLVSIITSLYKGGDYINFFLENITSQTIFTELCELIIIDADSPEDEYKIIQEYMGNHGNIKYIRTDEVIGIYDAWNLGVQNASGLFLTNANLDDARSLDCLEKQASALLKNKDCDLVYQDFYYSFTPNLPFDIVAECNVKSRLPVVTRANMLQFNSPHNAPMWRKSLHERIGLFNTRYKAAGDYEMWLRALLHGSKFTKIHEPLAVYYNNPFGLSTRSETAGIDEANDIYSTYVKMFGNNFFSMGKEEFIQYCKISFSVSDEFLQQTNKTWQNRETILYNCFDCNLKKLANNKIYVSLTT